MKDLSPGANVVVMVRPESIVLHRKKPSETANVVEGKVATVMFLGEYLDCAVELGKNLLQTHQPHSLQVRRGETMWVELPPAECMALPA
jgi:iron(III) transport system ATP-binding protein